MESCALDRQFRGLAVQGKDLLAHGGEVLGALLLDLAVHLLEILDGFAQRLEFLLDGFVTLLELARLLLLALLEALAGLREELVAAGFQLFGRDGGEGLLEAFPILLELLDLLLGGCLLGLRGGPLLARLLQLRVGPALASDHPRVRGDGPREEGHDGDQEGLHFRRIPSSGREAGSDPIQPMIAGISPCPDRRSPCRSSRARP